MPSPLNFIDNLENLRIVMITALEHVQENRDPFVKCASGVQVQQAEKSICHVRVLMTQLEREFVILEYLTTEDAPSVSAAPKT